MTDLYTEFASQTQSSLSSLGTLLREHETAMRDLDREIAEQDLEGCDPDTIYRMKVCAEKRALLEQNRDQILDDISESEIMLSAIGRISQLEITCSGLQDQLKLMIQEGDKVKEQLEDTRQQLDLSQQRLVSLEGKHEEVKFLAALSSRAEAALTRSVEVTTSACGGEDRSAHMHIDESTEVLVPVPVSESQGDTLPELSDRTKKQLGIISDYGKTESYDIAVNLSRKALEDLTDDTVQCKVDRAILLNTLALIYRDMDRPNDGIALLKEALVIREELHGLGHLGVASISNNLAIFYSKTHQYELAEESCKKALSVKERLLGVESVDVARQISNLALISQSRNKFEDAEYHFMRALDIYKTSLGDKDKSVLKTMTELGQCYLQQKRWEEAESLLKQVVCRGEEVALGTDTNWPVVQPIIMQCINSIKQLYLTTNNTERLKIIEKTHQRLSRERKRVSITRPPAQSMLPKLSNVPSRSSPTPPIQGSGVPQGIGVQGTGVQGSGVPRSESRGSSGMMRPIRGQRRDEGAISPKPN